MKKYLLLILFLTLLASEMFGIKLGISQGLSAKNLFLYLLLILIVIEKAQSQDDTASIAKIHITFILLIFVSFSSWLVTDIHRPVVELFTKEDRFRALKGLLIDNYLFFIVFFYSAKTIKDVVFLLKWIIILISISTFITIIDVYDIPDLGIIKQMEDHEAGRGRVQGPLGEPNQYAAFLILFIPIYVAFIKISSGLFKYFCVASMLLTSVVLILTGSRGGIAGLLLGALISLIMLKKHIKTTQIFSYLIKASIFGFTVISIALYKYSDVIMRRVEATTETKDAVTASAGRLWIWELGWHKMTQNMGSFLYGMGWNSYKGYIGVNSHNTYFAWLFELGTIGLILNLMIIFYIFKIVKNGINIAERPTKILLGGFFFGYASMLISVFFVNLFNPWIFIWAYTALMTRLAILAHSNSNEKPLPAVIGFYNKNRPALNR